MENKQRLFIYDYKEIGILVFLGVLIAVFAFTLGVHLGKRVRPQTITGVQHAEPAPIPTVEDHLPPPQELSEQSSETGKAVDQTLNQSLHDEVQRTGVKLDTPRPVDLPTEVKSNRAE